MKNASLREKVVQFIGSHRTDLLASIPTKYEKYGHVLVIHTTYDELDESVAKALTEALKVDVIITSARSTGELRVPSASRLLWPRNRDTPPDTAVFHRENGIVYYFDPMQLMFSSGNVNERSRFGTVVTASNETVVDMFAGIGYFSLPLATNRARKVKPGRKPLERPAFLVAIEKNDVSFCFLRKSFQRHTETACKHDLINGDNRTAGDEYIGQCHRILMGYLPDTAKFIPRALEFAAKAPREAGMPRAIIHYHFLFHKREDPASAVKRDFAQKSEGVTFKVNEVRKIKSYAHNVFHAVADVHLY